MDDDDRRPGSSPRVIGKVIRNDADLSASGERAPRRAAVVNSEEFEARNTAKQIIADAKAMAERMIADAEAKREDVFAKAKEKAYAEVQANATGELARAKLQAGQIIAGAENEIVDLSLKIAAKIIGRDLEREPTIVMEVAANIIQDMRAAKAMVLRVHPEDGKLLRQAKPKLLELIGRSVDVAIRDDTDVGRGGCLVQTEFGVIDGQIRTQFEMLENTFRPDTAKKETK